VIQRAKAGGLELGAFTAKEPTEVDEGEPLEPGDVVAVPVVEGDPAQALDSAAEARGGAVPAKYEHIDFTPPKGADVLEDK
jgi:hypothetical protein